MKRRLFIGSLFLGTILTVVVLTTCVVKLHIAADAEDAAQDRLLAAITVKDTLMDAESGVRGFIITGDEAYLEHFHDMSSIVDQQLLTLDPMVDSLTAHKISTDVHTKFTRLTEAIRIRRDEGFDAVQAILATNIGKHITDDVRDVVQKIQDEETKRASAAVHALKTLGNVIIIDSIILLLLVGGLIRIPWNIRQPDYHIIDL